MCGKEEKRKKQAKQKLPLKRKNASVIQNHIPHLQNNIRDNQTILPHKSTENIKINRVFLKNQNTIPTQKEKQKHAFGKFGLREKANNEKTEIKLISYILRII